MPRNNGNRKWETQCPVCLELVGVVNTEWNQTRSRAVRKTSRHAGAGNRTCAGSQLSVPESAILPGPGMSLTTSMRGGN